MALPHKEWRAYLDKILDSYIRTNITVDAVEYMVDRMEDIFSEYLVTVPEYSPNAVYPLNLDLLETFLAHPDVRSAIPIVPPGATGVEEKWVVKREIMSYIKDVVELGSLKTLKNGPRSRTLPTMKCWVSDTSDERVFQPMYMEPALLTRKAKAETPLQTNEFQETLTPRRKYGKTKTSRLGPPNSNGKRLPAQKRDSFFTSILATALETVPVNQETMSKEESEKLLMPKLSIPRTALEGVWSCIKATPFSSGLKNTMPIVGHLRSERVMTTVDCGDTAVGTNLGGRISPPLFPRKADVQQRGSHSTYAATSGIKVLKEVLKPAFMDIDMETQEEDMMANMRIAEGWPTIPIYLRPSSTPPMTADRSQRNAEESDDEDEDVLQIDELMLPSSPPFGNKELKELFRTRMDEILLPRKEYPLCRLGGAQSTMADRQTANCPKNTLSITLKETLHLPAASASQTGATAEEGFTTRETHETMDLGPEVVEVLDELCRGVKGLDKYSAITKDTLEDKDGMFLSVPSLPPPSHGLIIATLPDIIHLGKPFEILPLSDVLTRLNIVFGPSASVTLVGPAKGLTGLKLELSWQPFVYRGPVVSHETVCDVHLSPFHTPQNHREDVERGRSVSTVQMANQLLEVLAATREAEEEELFGMASWEEDDYNHTESSSSWGLEDGWSGAGVLLLTRAEIQRVKGLSANQYAPGNQGETPATEDPLGFIQAESQYGAGESPAMELSSGIGLSYSAHNFPPLTLSRITESPEDMVLDENPLPPDDTPQYRHQSEVNPSPYFQRETGPLLYSQHAVSAVDTDGHGIVESGSSHGYESAIGISRTPIGNHFSYFQTGEEEMAPFVEDDMGRELLDIPPTEFDFSPFIANDIDNPPSSPKFQRSPHHSTSFSNVNLLQDFLAHRAATGFQYASHHMEGTPALEATAQMIEDSFEARTESLSAESDWLTLPPELLSKTIVLPEQWSIPSTRHRYLASFPFIQRRGLVQKLKADCSVDLSEVNKAIEADLIVDTHTAVKFITVSDLVPSNFEALTSSIIGLGYGFTRILIVLEAYPFSWSTLSAQKLESSHWEGLKLITHTVVSTFRRLRRTVIIGTGMLEGPDDQGGAGDLDHVQLEFVLSWSPDDTVRLVRRMGDYAESVVSDWERAQLWGPRLWLEASDVLTHYKHRGMNAFAALAIVSITPFPDFIQSPLLEKLKSFGRLVGDKRMKLFHQQAKGNNCT